MRCLADTSLILRLNEPRSPLFKIVGNAVDKLQENGGDLFVVPQVLVEFWVVATRPKNVNGLGFTVDEAEQEIDRLQQLFTVLPENENIFNRWKTLVTQYKVSGKVAHDARIVAAMIEHGIENILTLNPGDFKRFEEINVMIPQDI